MRIRTRYEPSEKVQVDTGVETKVDPSKAKDCDVNVIWQRYKATGLMPEEREKQYLDCTTLPDFSTAVQTTMAMQRLMFTLPAGVRAMFGNSVSGFADFVGNPANSELLQHYGIQITGAYHEALDVPTSPAAAEGVPSAAGKETPQKVDG